MVIGGFRRLRVVNKVRKSTGHGGKRLTLVKESYYFPEFESLILCQNPDRNSGRDFLVEDEGFEEDDPTIIKCKRIPNPNRFRETL